MDQTTYDQVASELLSRARQIELDKRPSYTIGSGDVLRNFKSVAERSHTTARQVWLTYFLKHIDAVTAWAADPTIPQAEPIMDRFADAINYLKLGFALGAEEESEKSQTALPSQSAEDHHYFAIVSAIPGSGEVFSQVGVAMSSLEVVLACKPTSKPPLGDLFILRTHVRLPENTTIDLSKAEDERFCKLFRWNAGGNRWERVVDKSTDEAKHTRHFEVVEHTSYFLVVAESRDRKDLPGTILTRCKTLAGALLFCPPSTACADYYIVKVQCGDHVSEEIHTKWFRWDEKERTWFQYTDVPESL